MKIKKKRRREPARIRRMAVAAIAAIGALAAVLAPAVAEAGTYHMNAVGDPAWLY